MSQGTEGSVAARLNAALEGRYRIVDDLGEGGMATVFLAEDLKHDRQVALKVLKPELAAVVGGERFLSEIRTTANLQHPHILPLFDSGEADGFLFYVMPYVEDESLRDLLDREKQLPVDQAVELIRKVAGALQHAHDRGVVHRDIKPANILLSEGEPLVADFGIALAVTSAGGDRVTETGLSLGTPHYMSPEQASGDRTLDVRSDVYALGCVLYEMLAGEPPFPGPTPQAVLARILTAHAGRVTGTRPTVPPHVDAAVARALEKLPADRFESVDDFRKALTDPSFRHDGGGPVSAEPRVATPSKARGWRWAPALLVVMGLVGLWGWLRPTPEAPFRALAIVLDSAGAQFGHTVAVAPDGATLAYVSQGSGLAIRPLDGLRSRFLEVETLARTPFFSPDGAGIAYHAGTPQGSSIRWQRADGGGAILIDEGAFPGGTWADDGFIYYTKQGAAWRARAEGGEPERLPNPDSLLFFWPEALPDGRLIVQEGATPAQARPVIYDPETGSVRPVEGAGLQGSTGMRYAGGFVFWLDSQQNLMAARIDLGAAQLSSPAVNLATNVLMGGPGGDGDFAVGREGTVVYSTGVSSTSGQGENLAWVTRSGAVEVLEERLAEQLGDFDGLALGPDERYVAVQVEPPEGNLAQQIWIFDTRQGTIYPLTFGSDSYDAEWLDENRVGYLRDSGDGTAILAQPWDRSGPETTLVELERPVTAFEAGPGGSPLLVTIDEGEAGGLYLVDPGAPESLRPYVVTSFDEWGAAISPDGRWVAYVSNETGREEIFVRSFPGPGRPWPISTEPGANPRWGPDSDEVFYESEGRVIAATLDFSQGVEVAERTPLFDTQLFELTGYEMARDGDRFLIIREPTGADVGSTVLLLNVFDEIERRLP